VSVNSYKSVVLIKKDVGAFIDSGRLDQALRLIYDFVEQVFTEPLCTAQFFGSVELDALCQAIGRASLEVVGNAQSTISQHQSNKKCYVYIVTRLQNSGGHTKVIEDLIKARPHGEHIILATELIGKSDLFSFIEECSGAISIDFRSAPKVSFLEKLMWLQSSLISIRACHTYLFNHHQDAVAVAAIQPEMLLDASFYHHGDHHLCLGVYLKHLEHIDPHPMGYHNCRDALGIDNVYLPLVVDDLGERLADGPFLATGVLTTCTAARSNKVEIPYFISYIDFVPELLEKTGGRHIHIGKLTPWALFKIRRGLVRRGISSDKFVYIPWVRSVWKALHENRVDLYIASFPYGGGLTLIEAMGAGVPVALHKHVFSRILSGIELAYPEAFSWRYPEELLNYCASLNAVTIKESGRLSRKQYETFHRREILQAALSGDGTDILYPLPMANHFLVEADEWMFWTQRQVSLGRVISRFFYRCLRRVRALFNSIL
jgi:hypothetical protein